MKALRLLTKQYKDKFKLVESGELEFNEFQRLMEYYMHEFMTIIENS